MEQFQPGGYNRLDESVHDDLYSEEFLSSEHHVESYSIHEDRADQSFIDEWFGEYSCTERTE